MENVEQAGAALAAKPAHPVTVSVNEREVHLPDRKDTGAQIKAAAIAQGVQIQPDFALFELKGQGTLKQVADDEEVTLHPNQKFRAVAPDDNS